LVLCYHEGMDLPSVEKQTLRKKVQKDIDALTPAAREEENSALVARLTDWARLTGWEWVLATLPFPDEPNLVPFLAFWLASGHRVALARTGPGRSLDFGEVESMEGPWLPKPCGNHPGRPGLGRQGSPPLSASPAWRLPLDPAALPG